MREEKITADRMAAYSDAFAVIVTIMVLELKAPDQLGFQPLLPLWPTAISYAVSYLFIAINWINHDYLMRFVGRPTLGLIWTSSISSWCRSCSLRRHGLLPMMMTGIQRMDLSCSERTRHEHNRKHSFRTKR
jgi:Endosomal/lysosomal potassium channel TMEM175